MDFFHEVEKIPYDINAADIVFDITKEQPQLFVAQDFKHLNNVLDQFSNKMAFKRGGDYAIELAKQQREKGKTKSLYSLRMKDLS